MILGPQVAEINSDGFYNHYIDLALNNNSDMITYKLQAVKPTYTLSMESYFAVAFPS